MVVIGLGKDGGPMPANGISMFSSECPESRNVTAVSTCHICASGVVIHLTPVVMHMFLICSRMPSNRSRRWNLSCLSSIAATQVTHVCKSTA